MLEGKTARPAAPASVAAAAELGVAGAVGKGRPSDTEVIMGRASSSSMTGILAR
jgi:hypothetical protein